MNYSFLMVLALMIAIIGPLALWGAVREARRHVNADADNTRAAVLEVPEPKRLHPTGEMHIDLVLIAETFSDGAEERFPTNQLEATQLHEPEITKTLLWTLKSSGEHAKA